MKHVEVWNESNPADLTINHEIHVLARNPGGAKRHLSHTELAAANGTLLGGGSSEKNEDEQQVASVGEEQEFIADSGHDRRQDVLQSKPQ